MTPVEKPALPEPITHGVFGPLFNRHGMYAYADTCMAPLLARIEELHKQLDGLLAHCPDGECAVCSSIVCPNKDGMHFHHDGCPSCAQDEVDAALSATKDPS